MTKNCYNVFFNLLLLGSMSRLIGAAESPVTTEISPTLLVFGTRSGNVIASVGADGALLVGTPSVDSTAAIAETLAARTKSPLRYVVIAPEDLAHSEGDAGWGRRGAFVAMQENALERLGGHAMGPPRPLPERLVKIGVDRPRIAFSEVLTFDLNGEATHVVHQAPAYSNADALVHFHAANLIYLGEVFPGDGYPKVDSAQGGNLDGLIRMLSAWTGSSRKVVPARGKVTNGADVQQFRDMIVTVRGRVQQMANAGRNEGEVQAAHPSAEFDARWGHGRVTPAEFVSELYNAVKQR
jgi:cyclase